MTQLTFGDMAACTPLPELTDDRWFELVRAVESIAVSTLLEFDNALAWGQWCRRTAARAMADAKRQA